MKIQEIMTKDPATVTPGTTVRDAAKLMQREDTGILPVVESEGTKRLVGVVTDRDITIRIVAEQRDPQSIQVREVASTDLVTIDPQQDMSEALRLMAQHQVRRLPVVEEGRLVGIVAQADVAQQGTDAKTGQVVEEISR